MRSWLVLGFSGSLFFAFWILSTSLAWSQPSSGQSPSETWSSLILKHLDRYPEARAQDLYKLVFQATRGPEHAAPSYEVAWRRMQREWEDLPADANGLLWEPIRPDGRLGRLHIGAFKALGGSPEALTQCFVQSAQEFQVEQEAFFDALQEILQERPGNSRAIREFRWFLQQMSRQKYPPVHHSDPFRQNYRPAYRVIELKCLGNLGVQHLLSSRP